MCGVGFDFGGVPHPSVLRVQELTERLVTEGLVDRTYLHDPWARPYHYALTENGYLLSGVDDSGKAAPGTVVERVLPAEKR